VGDPKGVPTWDAVLASIKKHQEELAAKVAAAEAARNAQGLGLRSQVPVMVSGSRLGSMLTTSMAPPPPPSSVATGAPGAKANKSARASSGGSTAPPASSRSSVSGASFQTVVAKRPRTTPSEASHAASLGGRSSAPSVVCIATPGSDAGKEARSRIPQEIKIMDILLGTKMGRSIGPVRASGTVGTMLSRVRGFL